jgi:hypothetical protein
MNPGILTFLGDRFGQPNVTKMGTMAGSEPIRRILHFDGAPKHMNGQALPNP